MRILSLRMLKEAAFVPSRLKPVATSVPMAAGMKAKHEAIRGERLFYCFVNFGTSPEARPVVHVLPAAFDDVA